MVGIDPQNAFSQEIVERLAIGDFHEDIWTTSIATEHFAGQLRVIENVLRGYFRRDRTNEQTIGEMIFSRDRFAVDKEWGYRSRTLSRFIRDHETGTRRLSVHLDVERGERDDWQVKSVTDVFAQLVQMGVRWQIFEKTAIGAEINVGPSISNDEILMMEVAHQCIERSGNDLEDIRILTIQLLTVDRPFFLE